MMMMLLVMLMMVTIGNDNNGEDDDDHDDDDDAEVNEDDVDDMQTVTSISAAPVFMLAAWRLVLGQAASCPLIYSFIICFIDFLIYCLFPKLRLRMGFLLGLYRIAPVGQDLGPRCTAVA